MKKFITLLTAVAILLTSMAVAAAQENVDLSRLNYNFDSFTSILPDGLSGVGTAASLDNIHGVSLKDSGITKLNIGSSLTKGTYRLSFDMAMDAGKVLTIRARSAEYEGHYLLYFKSDSIQISGDTGKDKWSFTNFGEYEPLKWYRYDFIIEMGGNVICYVNGEKAGEVKANFDDIIGFTFLGEGSGYYYLDNLKFDVFDSYIEKEGSVKATDSLIETNRNEIGFLFSETLNDDSVTEEGIKAYSMGENPIALNKTPISFTIAEKAPNYVKLNFGSELQPGIIYKVEFLDAVSVFGKAYAVNEAYFSVEGNLKEIDVLYDDFTGITPSGQGSWMWMPIIPTGKTSKDKWDVGGTCRAFPCWTDEVSGKTAVEFKAYKGESAVPNADVFISKAMPVEMKTKAEIEFRVKIDQTGTFNLSIGDSSNIYTRLVEFNENGINVLKGEDYVEKVADITIGEFMDIKLSIDLVNGLFDIYIDGEKCNENSFSLSSAAYGGSGGHATNIKKLRFLQHNKYKYDSEDNTEESRAHTYLEYVKTKSFVNIPSIAYIYFTDALGNNYYPEYEIPTDVVKMNILFAGDIDGETLVDSITLTNYENGEVIIPSGTYNNAASLYELELPNYLAGASEYMVDVSESIADKTGESIDKALSGAIYTQGGKFEATGINVSSEGNTVDVTADVIHTNASFPKFYIIYAGYQGTRMKGFDFREIELTEMQRRVEVKESFTIENISEFERVKGFIWDGFDTMIPLFDFDEFELNSLN